MSLIVRPYEPQDDDRVKAIFGAGMMELARPLSWAVVKTPRTWIAHVIASSVLLCGTSLQPWFGTVSTLVCLFTLYAALVYIVAVALGKRVMSNYVKECLADDMRDIPQFYGRGGSVFLVADAGAGTGVVGTVALDGSRDLGGTVLLRRMVCVC